MFPAAYGIAATFHTVTVVVGGNSIAGVVSVTPAGVGVNQVTDVASLRGVTDVAATACSLGRQLTITRWNGAGAVGLASDASIRLVR